MNNTTIGGSTFIRNAIELDYPIEACIRSLMGACDRVVVLDCGSDDGTDGILRALHEEFEGRMVIHPFPFTLKQHGHRWLLQAINHARITLMGMGMGWHLQLDADEVVHEMDHDAIRTAVQTNRPQFLYRRNFWGRPDVQLKDDVACGTWVARLAQVTVPNVSDEPYHPSRQPLSRLISHRDGIQLFHYGFCRDRRKFFMKARLMEDSYFKHHNLAWDTMSDDDDKGFQDLQEGKTMSFTGSHPMVIREWLQQRSRQ